MKYIFADFKFEIEEKYDYLYKEAKDYLGFFDIADFILSANDEDLKYEQKLSQVKFENGYLEFIALLRKIGEILPLHNAFVLHSACFRVDGTGVVFAAPSGTGKTTHLNRWKSYLKDRLTVVNGDKPIVRFINSKPIAFGTPWCGKEKLGNNTNTEIKHICFVERSDTNYVEKVSREEAINRIFNQVYMPKTNPMAIQKTMELIDKLLSDAKLWIIHCNKDENAGEIVYNQIFK